MKCVKLNADGHYVDENNRDISDLIRAYEAFACKSRAGMIGGAVKSKAKEKAARMNGRKGGRPRKVA